MHFFTYTSVCLSALLAVSGVSAAPATSDLETRDAKRVGSGDAHRALMHLHKHGKVNWTEHGDGRVAFMSHEDGLTALKDLDKGKKKKQQRSILDTIRAFGASSDAGVEGADSWTDAVPQIFGKAAYLHCFGSGPKVPNWLVQRSIGPACSAMLKTIPGAIALKGWQFYQMANQPDEDGNNIFLDFRLEKALGTLVAPITQDECTAALNEVLKSQCASNGNMAASSQGGLLQVAEDFRVAFDPQNQEDSIEQHHED